MIVIAILGILAAMAIPLMSGFIRRSKSAEASAQLTSLFQHAAAYYSMEHAGAGMGGEIQTACTVAAAGPRPLAPTVQKQLFEPDAGFRALNFGIGDYVYYSYVVQGPAAQPCGHPALKEDLYTFSAHGDLDGDGVRSTFELAAGTDSTNNLYHARAVFISEDDE